MHNFAILNFVFEINYFLIYFIEQENAHLQYLKKFHFLIKFYMGAFFVLLINQR